MYRQYFFFDAADGQNFAPKRDLAGHGHIAANRNMRQGAHDGGTNGDARRRPVFRDGAFGNVHVDIQVAIEVMRQAEGPGARAHITHGRLGRFLHHVTELACEREPALAMHQSCLGGQYLAADFGPGQANGEADLVFLFGPELAELNDAEEFIHVCRCDLHLHLPAFLDHAPRDLAADIGNLTLQIPHARFLRVMPDDVVDGVIGELQVLFGQASSLALLFEQEALGDLPLFDFGIARQTQGFHAILQGLRDGVQDVGRADEHHV